MLQLDVELDNYNQVCELDTIVVSVVCQCRELDTEVITNTVVSNELDTKVAKCVNFIMSLTLKQPLKLSNEVDSEEFYHYDPFLDF